MCTLSDNIMDYHVVSQGKTSIPGVDDGDELIGTDVRKIAIGFPSVFFSFWFLYNRWIKLMVILSANCYPLDLSYSIPLEAKII